jgi:hypothetical protein
MQKKYKIDKRTEILYWILSIAGYIALLMLLINI